MGRVSITCADVGSWRFALVPEHATNDVVTLLLTAEATAESTVPAFTLGFHVPRKNLHHAWHPFDERFPCSWPRQYSSFSSGLPLRANFDDNERNVLTFAVSDALHAIRFLTKVDLQNDNAHAIKLTAAFFSEVSAPMRRYKTKIRIDTRKIFWSQAVTDGVNWISSTAGLTPTVPPTSAFAPLYSTWYAFRDNVTQAALDPELDRAAALGMKAVILDDGWQLERGDWQIDTAKFPDLRAQVRKAHALDMRYLLWLAVPHVTKDSPAWTRFQGKFLSDKPNQWGIYVLDPRYPEVRRHLATRLTELMRTFELDGFKLDFIDEFIVAADDPAARNRFAGCDFKGVPEAAERLLGEISAGIRSVRPDALVEFRQRYVGPVVRQYGNMLRANDCPGDFMANRYRTLALRVSSPGSAVHSDMLLWRADDTVEELKRQVWNVMFSTVQYSAFLGNLPESHRAAIGETIAFQTAHCPTLQHGILRPHRPELGYPWVEAEGPNERIVAVYAPDTVIPIVQDGKRTLIVNATTASRVTIRIGNELKDLPVSPSDYIDLKL